MVEVVFHVGAHKCATTSIQRGLEALAAETPSLVYVPPSRANAPGAGGEPPCPELTAFTSLLRKAAPEGATRQSVVDGLCRLIESHAGKRRIVFSDEMMIGGMPGLAWKFYPRADVTRAVIDEVARRFPVSVLLQSRESASYLRSCHQFRVRFGMTLGYLPFLERFDLGSVSWTRLGRSLFDGAAFEWRVLPIEHLSDPDRAGEVAAALRLVSPDWDASERPLGVVNISNGPLMRAATLVLQRAGRKFDTRPRARVASALAAIEAEAASLGADAANALIVETLARVKLKVDPRIANMIRLQAEEERLSGGSLHRLLVERYAEDYAGFVSRYVDRTPSRPAQRPALFGARRS